jgi:hypothetical protein
MTGSPRSGTTWLAELLTAGTGFCALIEPLHLTAVPEAYRAGFNWRTLVAPGTRWPQGEAYLQDVFSGRVLTPFTTSGTRFRELVRRTGWLVKFVRANRMLPWLVERFPLRGFILLVRHPFAVVASQLRDPRFVAPMDLSSPEHRQFLEAYPHFTATAKECRSPVECFALQWCMDQHVPIASPYRDRWLTVRYEDLVGHGEQELERVFDFLRLPMTDRAVQQLRVASREAKSWSAIVTGDDEVAASRSSLSDEQRRQIRAVVTSFGVHSPVGSLYEVD